MHWDLRAAMTELDVECIVQRAREKYPRRAAKDHQRQRPPVPRGRLQGVHPRDGDDACPYVEELPAVERTLKADARSACRLSPTPRKPGVSSPPSSTTTTGYGFTAPSATSPRPITSPAGRVRSGLAATRVSKLRASSDASGAPTGLHEPRWRALALRGSVLVHRARAAERAVRRRGLVCARLGALLSTREGVALRCCGRSLCAPESSHRGPCGVCFDPRIPGPSSGIWGGE